MVSKTLDTISSNRYNSYTFKNNGAEKMNQKTETLPQTLARIESGFSKNDFAAIKAFAHAGIDPESLQPRINILTYKAWRAKGRQVSKGAISVRVTVWIPTTENGKKKMIPKNASLFHESQTIAQGGEKGVKPEAWKNEELFREGSYT